MEWAGLIALYPVLSKLVAKAPELKSLIEDLLTKKSPDGASLLMHLEQIQRMEDQTRQMEKLKEYVLCANIAGAKLANPDVDESEFLKAWRFATDQVKTIKSV